MITSPELFINMKSYPTNPDSDEYFDFWEAEKEKCRNGVTINGVYISGWLYWHINHWRIWIDGELDEWGEIPRISSTPQLRDNEWLLAEAEFNAKMERKGLIICGSRQFGKSEFIASYTARTALLFEGSQNVVVGSNSDDLATITSKIDYGLLNCSPYFRMPRITRNWDDGEVLLGYKDGKNDNHLWSTFWVRNTQDGRRTEVTAGTTMKSLIYDEIGKAPFKKSFIASKPALLSKHGWRCIPILVGTGGAFDKGNDAESIFNDPGSQNLLEFPHSTKPGVKVGLFVPGTYRQDAKKETTLSEFLGLEKGTELDIPMQVRDIPKAMQIIEDNLKAAKRDPDPTIYLKEKAYYPLEEEDMFIPITETVFPIDLLQGQLEFINQNHIQSECVELYKDREGKIRHKPTTKVPVTTFPIKPSDNNEGVVQIWEYPVIDAPPGLYTAGMDPYKFSQAVYSDSLGALYIYKRVHDLSGEGWRNMVVACYVGRPKEINKWHETARLLLDFYNCKVLCENQDMSFINHCLAKNDAFKYLERTPSFLDEIHPNSTVNRVYGIHMTNDIKGYLIGRIIEYLTEVIDVEYDDQGNKVKERLGVTRILDPMLIKELMKYAKKGNFDRVISFGLTLAMAKNMDPVYNVTDKVDNRYEAYNNIAKRKKTLFTQTRNPFRSY